MTTTRWYTVKIWWPNGSYEEVSVPGRKSANEEARDARRRGATSTTIVVAL